MEKRKPQRETIPYASLGEADLLRLPSLHQGVLSLDEDQYAQELTGGVYAERVREHRRSGVANGVRSTPTFFIEALLKTSACKRRGLKKNW